MLGRFERARNQVIDSMKTLIWPLSGAGRHHYHHREEKQVVSKRGPPCENCGGKGFLEVDRDGSIVLMDCHYCADERLSRFLHLDVPAECAACGAPLGLGSIGNYCSFKCAKAS